tara:strand:+ start:132 stop:1070 length:939 start_codon:yes stop_codon:yes gene_type:complete
LRDTSFPRIYRNNPEVLQVNLGYKCNQACGHCHVNAGPARTEMMAKETIKNILEAISIYNFNVLDITGGAPEMHEYFEYLVTNAKKLKIEIIDRCNLTILKEPGYEHLINFLSQNKVKIVASLPCYLEENVDLQRGKGVFKKSIQALIELNKAGYAEIGTELYIDLVYNPQGPVLPPSQKELEIAYRNHLYKEYGIKFNNLLVLANMPINRFSDQLKKENKLKSYMNLLKETHNESNLSLVMCTNTISVDWQGNLFDCDFNQQLRINDHLTPRTLKELISKKINLKNKEITVDDHCFGCTAGSGSSCGGALS